MELNALNMAQHAPQHVHTNDVVLTMGYSPHVELFLKTAAKKGRSYHVIVAEGGPEKLGRKMACSLASEGVAVTLISDAAVFAVMPKVNKVVLGTYLVMSNGGIRAMCGSHLVALAASRYAVPVLICSTSSALVPEYPEVFEESMMHKAPFHDFAPKALCVMKDGTRPAMCNPMYDYVPPDLISIFLFNSGGYVPSYVYSLRSELYSLEDISWIPGRSPDGEKLSQ
ncbi:unnamed protein product [Notodromas monacha]|nr:unnamed protein product [Notodromas monacha]CAG0915955.1 unnamed protein product [Notodromas monacha]